MSLYVVNEGEQEMMRCILAMQEWHLGLYKNVFSPSGALSMLNIEEMPTGGGRGYAQKTLSMDFALAQTTDKWYIAQNAAGKSEGIYSDDYLDFEFNSADVADGNTVYGAFAFCYVIPFDAGTANGPFVPGDTVTGASSTATAVVTGMILTSGAWDGSAAGYLFVKTKSATAFQDGENLQVSAVTVAVSNTGTLYGGDAHKKLIWVAELPEAKLIDTSGQKVQVRVKWTLTTQ